ncbi:hypothetical protein Acsp03_24550 [Actinomadura sp. NBRC 104412]|uniref:hypothetical protein n=1 Tax=Actinomadura sp. NBRC 104412 TaxID=3032203 RepID=UPI0024A3CB53|nr:hypothetical protein [Actinomadura sp. NBRC 104412]GLZ04989.1 hypothetical protein Acsp03_24550 [Actinomadura sp. NBRC 104412]
MQARVQCPRPDALVMVVLVRQDADGPSRMPVLTVPELPAMARHLERVGIPAVKVFASPTSRTGDERGGVAADSLMARAVATLKDAAPGLTVMTGTCLCSWTSLGECHHTGRDGAIDLPATVEALAAQAIAQAEAGVEVIGPAAMAPGQVTACRRALDETGHGRTQIMPHLVVSSALYAG